MKQQLNLLLQQLSHFYRRNFRDTASIPAMKRYLQLLLFFRVVVLSLLLGLTMLLQPKGNGLILPPIQHMAYFIAAIYLFSIISALALNRTDQYQQFTYLQLITDVILVTFLVYFTGGSRSIFTITYLLPIIIGGLMLYKAGGLFFATMSTMAHGIILLFEYRGYASFYTHGKGTALNFTLLLHHFSVYGLIFFVVGLLTIFLSERLRRTEEALTQTAQDFDRLQFLYKQIFDDISTGIITVDASGRITSFNHASEEITGYRSLEVVGAKLDGIFPGLTSGKDQPLRQEGSITQKSRAQIPIGFSWAKLNLAAGSDDSRVYTMQDLSQIKKMEDAMRQAEKMAAIGEMAAGVAHEFRNPLAAISGAAQMLAQETSLEPHNQQLMNIITRESDRLETTIRDFLQFSKPVKPQKNWFSFNNLLEESLEVIRQNPRWNENCQIKLKVPDKLDCWGDRGQLKQVLLNIIDNACNALSGEPGTITIMAGEHTTLSGNEKTVITVANDGPPIPEELLHKIFEPFFTTRESGTGLGLAIVWQIITSHAGTIKVGSRADEGTAFVITLPFPHQAMEQRS